MKLPSRGLSPSSFKTYMGCNRKYFYEKIVELPADPDAEQDTEALMVGKAFHQVLEDTRHNLKGVTIGQVLKTCLSYELTDENTAAMIWAMLAAYKRTHEASGLTVLECEKIIETPTFYGIFDAVMAGPEGWYIVDMKTAASWSPDSLLGTLPTDPQMALYAAHAPLAAEFFNLSMRDFKGLLYRAAIKMRVVRKADESLNDYALRLSKISRCYEIQIPASAVKASVLMAEHSQAVREIQTKIEASLGDVAAAQEKFPRNRTNCMSYFKPCKFWSQCHGETFTDMKSLVKVSGG